MFDWCLHKSPWIALLICSFAGFFPGDTATAYDDAYRPRPEEVLQYWFDPKGMADFANAQIAPFVQLPKRSMSFGFSRGALWLRLVLPAHHEAGPRRLWLELDSALLSHWWVFVPDSDQPVFEGGTTRPRADADQHRSPTYALVQEPGLESVWYIRIQSNYAINLNPHLHTTASLAREEKREGFFLGGFAGVMIFTYVLTLYLYIRTRHINFLYYSFLLLSFHLFYQFTMNHTASLYFWPQSPWWSDRSGIFAGEMTNFFGVLFIRDTLQTRRFLPKVDIFIRCVPLRCFFILGWALIDFSAETVQVALIISCLLLIFYYSVALAICRQGFRPAILFSIAWLPVLIGNILAFLQDLNLWVAADPSWQEAIRFEFPVIGAAIQAILLGVAVGDQFRRAEREQKREHLEREKLEQGLDDAHTVQDAFVRSDSVTPHFAIRSSHQMSAKIGGDWLGYYYDSHRKRLLLAISDVTGHGLPSALLTGALHGAFYGLVAAEPVQSLSCSDLLHTLMDRLDHVVRATGQNSGLMATLALVCVDMENFRIEYRNAGHTPILISGRKGQHFMLKGGSPLGISEEPHFGHDAWQAEAGDLLFLFTDGLLDQADTGQRNHLKVIAREIVPERDIDFIHRHIEQLISRNPMTLEDDSSYLLCRLGAA